MKNQKTVKQWFPIEIVVSLPRAGEFLTKVNIDLWGLVLGDDPTDAVLHELETVVLNKLTIKPTKGELKRLLAAHSLFHGKK